MARTAEGRILTDLHRRQQMALRASVVRDVMRLWPAWQPSKPDSYQAFERAMVLLVQSRSVQSAAISARYYEMFRAAEAPGRQIARTVALAAARDEEQIRAALGATTRGTVYKALAAGQKYETVMSNAFVNVSGTVSRDVLAGGRETIFAEQQRDPRAMGVARITGSAPCAFCAMLASRGAIYLSAESAGQIEGQEMDWHLHCDCSIEVAYEGYEMNARSLAQREQWNKSDGTLNGFRQDLNKTPDKPA